MSFRNQKFGFKNWRANTALLVILIASLQLQACSLGYSTKSIDKNAKSLVSNVTKGNNKIKTDLREFTSIYNSLMSKTSTPDSSPYPAISSGLQRMKEVAAEIDAMYPQALILSDRYAKLTRGKRSIPMSSPQLSEIRQDTDNFTHRYTQLGDKYGKERNQLIQIMKDSSIGKFNVAETRKKIDDYIVTSNQKLSQTRAALHRAQARKQVRNYAKLENLLLQMTDENNRLIALMENIKREGGNQKEYWVGPGMYTFTVKNDMEAIGRHITQLVEQFNASL